MVTLFPFTSATPLTDDISQPTIEITCVVIKGFFTDIHAHIIIIIVINSVTIL